MPGIRLATANDSRRYYFPVGRSGITKRTHIKLYVYIAMHTNKYIIYNTIYTCILYEEKRKCRNRFGTTAFVTNRNWPPFAFQYVSTIRAERLARKFLIRRGKMHLSYFAFLVLAPPLRRPSPPHPTPLQPTAPSSNANRRAPSRQSQSYLNRIAIAYISNGLRLLRRHCQ